VGVGGGPQAKAPKAANPGDHAPTKQASRGRAWVVKPQRLNNPAMAQAFGALTRGPPKGVLSLITA
jgi:hypothetical protein